MTQTVTPIGLATPEGVVVEFLTALERGDMEHALALVADDLTYINLTLPTIRGRNGLAKAFKPLGAGRVGFAVRVHHVASDGRAVLTDRTDELRIGRLVARFWVYGRFEVRDGQITLWRDAFDWVDVTIGMLRGLAGVVIPAANRRMPSA